jgi:uncharacterized iron-regulated protein
MNIRLLLVFSFLLFSFDVHAAKWQSGLLLDHPLVGKVVAVETKSVLSEQALVSLLDESFASGAYLLIGEKHDNPDHHRLESILLKHFARSGVSAIFEMLDDQQASSLPQLKPTHSLQQLKNELQWPAKGWSWQDYGPLFQLVLQQGAHLVAGNVDRQLIKSIYSEGEAVLKSDSRFQTVNVVSEVHTPALLDLVFESHCQQMPREHLKPMVTIQLAKDASMASALAETERGVLIAGNVHARKDIGVAAHLTFLEKRSVTVLLLEVQDGMLALSDYPEVHQGQADYVWFTPKVTARDYCEDLRGKAKQKASN